MTERPGDAVGGESDDAPSSQDLRPETPTAEPGPAPATEPGAQGDADEGAHDEDADAPALPIAGPAPGIFSLEGRRVPGLYLVAWLLTLVGGGAMAVSIGASGSDAALWLFLFGVIVLALGLMAGTGSQAVERAHRTDLAYRGPSPVLAFITVIAITLSVTAVVIGPLSAMGLDSGSPAATALSLAITAGAYLLVVRSLVVAQGSLTWRDIGLGRPAGAALRELAVGMLLAVPVLVITIALSLVLSLFLAPPPSPLPPSGDVTGLLLNLLAAAVLAPLGEELFFRGFTTSAWARVYGSRPAIVRGAVFFAIAHVLTLFDASFFDGLQRAVFSFVALLPVALTLGWLFLARRSLWAPVGLHAAFNGAQVLIAYLVASSIT